MLLRMEHALRNYLERVGLRLRLHAVDDEMNEEQLDDWMRDDWPLDEWQQGEELPGPGQLEGANAFAEQFELVRMDETGNRIAGALQDFMRALEVGRNAAIAEVANVDVLREQSIQTRCSRLRQGNRDEISRVRAQFRRRHEHFGEELRQRKGSAAADDSPCPLPHCCYPNFLVDRFS
ncbi:hypothetical protein P3T76_002393 [Phytophthora citrophthora]|uniref:Uncharacterized protein n=1 Tax=Phytophthora citrophthora TaxID=4793 RepID=A0AAD9GYD3_9STRA|nr:hypothetical protein P3T76_002393 [Phytophthora citrophthora]